MLDILAAAYPWVKSLHVVSVIAWMAGLFYLPRLFVYHVEQGAQSGAMDTLFQTMEYKLLRVIMNPAMTATWIFGLMLLATPGIVDWASVWIWIKLVMVLGMTWFHHLLARWRKDFAADCNTRPGRTYRLWNEAPTLMMVIIVIAVVVRPF